MSVTPRPSAQRSGLDSERNDDEALQVAEEATAVVRSIRYQQALDGDLDWFPWLLEMCRRWDQRNGIAMNLLNFAAPIFSGALVFYGIYAGTPFKFEKVVLMLLLNAIFVAIGSIPIYLYHCWRWRARRAQNSENG